MEWQEQGSRVTPTQPGIPGLVSLSPLWAPCQNVKTPLTFVEISGHGCYLHTLIRRDELQLHFELNQRAIIGVMMLKFCTTCLAILLTNECTCFSTGFEQAGPVGQGHPTSIQNAGLTLPIQLHLCDICASTDQSKNEVLFVNLCWRTCVVIHTILVTNQDWAIWGRNVSGWLCCIKCLPPFFLPIRSSSLKLKTSPHNRLVLR